MRSEPPGRKCPSRHFPCSLGGRGAVQVTGTAALQSPPGQAAACCLPASLHVTMWEELLQEAKGRASRELGMGTGLPRVCTSLRGMSACWTCTLKAKVSLCEAPASAEAHTQAEKAGPALGSGSKGCSLESAGCWKETPLERVARSCSQPVPAAVHWERQPRLLPAVL